MPLMLEEYQKEAAKTRNQTLNEQQEQLHAAMGLAEEAGELLGAMKKVHFYHHEPDKEAVKEELGDLLWYVADNATSHNLSLDEIAQGNIRKLRARYQDGFTTEESAERRDKKDPVVIEAMDVHNTIDGAKPKPEQLADLVRMESEFTASTDCQKDYYSHALRKMLDIFSGAILDTPEESGLIALTIGSNGTGDMYGEASMLRRGGPDVTKAVSESYRGCSLTEKILWVMAIDHHIFRKIQTIRSYSPLKFRWKIKIAEGEIMAIEQIED